MQFLDHHTPERKLPSHFYIVVEEILKWPPQSIQAINKNLLTRHQPVQTI